MANSMNKFSNIRNQNKQLYIDEDPIGEMTDETDPNFQKQTNEELYEEDGNQEAEEEENDSQSEYYEALGAGADQITKSMPNVPLYQQRQNQQYDRPQ